MSINFKELRCGNWVDGGTNGNLYYQIKPSDFVNTDFSKTNPIPLSAEILKACGFEYGQYVIDAHWWYRLVGIKTNNGKIVTFELNLFKSDGDKGWGINLEEQYFGYCHSLHQLMNIYHSITTEELTFKLSLI